MATRETVESTAVPVKKQRLVGVDATRGLALLGMMAVHALWAYDDEGNVTWTYYLVAGRSAATFAILAGIGIAFMTGRRRVTGTDRKAVAASLAVRAVIIAIIGLALGYADAEVTSVILAYYAVLFLLAIPLTFLPSWALVVTAVVTGVGMPVLSQVLRAGLPEASGQNPSFAQLVQDPGQLLTELTLTGVYPALPWMAYIATGLLIGRLRLASTRVATILLVAGAAMAVLASVVSWWLMDPLGGLDQLYATAPAAGMTAHDVDDMLLWGSEGTTPTTSWWWLATTAPHTTTPLSLLHTTGIAIALLGGMLLLADAASRDWPMLRVVLDALGMIGAMTLTLYTAHVVYMNSPLDVLDATTGYVIQVTVAVLFALIWRVFFDRGPLEALVTRAAHAGRRAVSSR